MTQHIDLRASQLLFNHGPGSILETTRGPVVVTHFGGLESSVEMLTNGRMNFPREFEIIEPRLSGLLPVGVAGGPLPKLHRVPSNSEIDNQRSWILSSKEFPNWLLCRNPDHPSGGFYLFQPGSRCPICPEDDFHTAIRFVAYCRQGHLDELRWTGAMHQEGEICQEATYEWRETTSAMSGIEITCTSCGNHRRLNELAQSIGACSGRHPHLENRGDPPERPRCDERAIVTLRQSSVLWQSDTKRVVTIPNTDSIPTLLMECLRTEINSTTPFAEILSDGEMYQSRNRTTIPAEFLPDPGRSEQFLHYIEYQRSRATGRNIRKHESLMRLSQHSHGLGDVRRDYERLIGVGGQTTMVDSLRAEFIGLMQNRDSRPTIENIDASQGNSAGRTIFRIDDGSIKADIGRLTIVGEPVTTLRTVTALVGFFRGSLDSDEPPPNIIETPFNDDGQYWYPSADAFGEGVLLWLDDDSPHLNEEGDRWNRWLSVHEGFVDEAIGDPNRVKKHLFRAYDSADSNDRQRTSEALVESTPEFVWWHTFAHHLIRVVQAETGYSSSAISERVYVVREGDRWRTAVLLYVTEGGMDGTLGGLTSLLPNLQVYFDRLLEDAEVCSNDPLCEEAQSPVVPNIGCYACTLNPETSCEHRNLFLDRLLMIEAAEL